MNTLKTGWSSARAGWLLMVSILLWSSTTMTNQSTTTTPPYTTEETTGATSPLPYTSNQTDDSTTPLPYSSYQTGGSTSPPPYTSYQTGGSTTPLPYTSYQTGGSTTPLPYTSYQTGGSTSPLPYTSDKTGGSTTLLSYTSYQTGGSSTPLPYTSYQTGSFTSNLPYASDQTGDSTSSPPYTSNLPYTSYQNGGSTSEPTYASDKTGVSTSPPPYTSYQTGGSDSPLPYTSYQTGGSTSPLPDTSYQTGGSTSSPPYTSDKTGGSTTLLSYTSYQTGGSTSPLPFITEETTATTSPLPYTAYQTGGFSTPLPYTSYQTGGSTSPPPYTSYQTGGSTSPLPYTSYQTAGSTSNLPYASDQTGGSTSPLPDTSYQTGGSTTLLSYTSYQTGGSTSPPPYTSYQTGGSTSPLPYTSYQTGGSTSPLPFITEETTVTTSPLPYTSYQTGGSTSNLPYASDQTGGSTSPLPDTSYQTGGSTTLLSYTSYQTGGSTSPPPYTSYQTGGSTSPLPYTSYQTGGSTSPLPFITEETTVTTSPLPYTSYQTGGSTSPPPYTSYQTGGSTSNLPYASDQTGGSTSPLPDTSYQTNDTTTAVPYTTSDTTTAVPYATNDTTTAVPYTTTDTTTAVPYTTTAVPYTTTAVPYTAIDTTTAVPPTTSDTPTAVPYTATDTTTAVPYTTNDTTTAVPYITSDTTTVVPYTISDTTTAVPYTTTDTTTAVPYTTTDTTTVVPYTTSDTTTAVPYTTTDTTTVVPYTTSDTTTAVPYTTSDTTTAVPYTTSNTTTAVPYTTSDTTTAVPYTTSDTTTAVPYTTTDTTTAVPYTTTAVPYTTTAVPYTATDTTTAVPPTTSDTPTAVPYTATDTTTAVPYTTNDTTTAVPYITNDTTTVVPYTTNGTTTAVPYTSNDTTTAVPYTTNDTTTAVPYTTSDTTTAVPYTTNDTTTAVPYTTSDTTTAVPYATNDTTTAVPDTTNDTTTAVPYTTRWTNVSTTAVPYTTSETSVATTSTPLVCGGDLDGTEGVLKSPLYPDDYPRDSLCRWVIRVDPGDTVRVTFSAFDLQDSFLCEKDSLELRDGPDGTGRLLERLCGDEIPSAVTSNDNVMHVQFASDSTVSHSGFKAKWNSVCEETYRWWSSDTIQSPSYPDSYPGRKRCTYFLEQWQGYVITLRFSHFNLGDSEDCQGQYMEIRDGGFDGSPLLGKRYCGSSLPPAWTSTSNLMTIIYVTDGSSNNTQFKATYTRDQPSCEPVTLTDRQGTFQTPLYPSYYPLRVDCAWTIIAEANHVIQLTFDTFTIEANRWCSWDWVKIYDGNTLLGTYCGVSAPETITSTGNTLRVEFNSDWIITYQGFSASYIAYDPYSDELTRQYELFPYGVTAEDTKLARKHDKVTKVYIDTGFPVGEELQYKVFVANKGLVSFKKRDKGRKLMLKTNKRMICPYHSDIGAPDSDGGVYYQLYTDNQAVLDKASLFVREFTKYKDYSTSLVLVVTWDRVAHVNSHNVTQERATVQLALMSDGQRSFALVFYKMLAMRWSVLDGQPLIIGFSLGKEGQEFSNVYSNTTEAFTRLDRIKGNTGRYGMWIYPIGDSYSADQDCQDWYRRNLPMKKERLAGFQRLPQCPCSWWWLWGNWRWAYWRDGYNVLCFRMSLSRSRQYVPHGKECCYDWNWWSWSTFGQYLSDPPHAGSATAYNPTFWSLRHDYEREDRRAHDVCCYNTTNPDHYCKKYYRLRPVGECSTRIPFSFSWTWGDPHIKTLDGGEYTFNGWGEYTMITLTSADLSFTLQGRTGMAETESGSVTNATVFTAFGADENGIRVFVGLDPNTNDTLIIYGNNTDHSLAFRDAGEDDVIVEAETYMLKRSNGSCVITFESEIQLTISIGYKALDISISMPLGYRNLTKGLLGNFNGVKDDDFVLPDNTILNSDLTDRQIYEDFGPKWAVTSSNTVMRYGPREGPADFAHPEFKPIFLDEVPAATRQAAEDLCGATNVACVYDYVATGSAAIANASRATGEKAEEREKVVKNTVPTLAVSASLNGTAGEALTFNLLGHDPDAGDILTYHVVDDAGGAVQVNSATGNVTLNVDPTKPFSLSFYAKDSNNGQSPTRDVTLIACSGCNGHGTCDFTRASAVTRDFLVAPCDCHPAWTGDDCEEEYDACEEGPCDVHQSCTDLTAAEQGDSDVGYNCTGCPDGFGTDPSDSTRCVDIDECSQDHNCSVLCTNLPGSYKCDCPDGYRLSADDVSCDDINECVERTDGCQQRCVNNKGNFTCQCFAGYTLGAKGTCAAPNTTTTTNVCSNATCHHGCRVTNNTHTGDPVAECFCNSGYELDPSDNSSCVDRDECEEGACSQSCVNTQGSFVCTCYVGHVMGRDQRTCSPCPSLRYGPGCRETCSCSGHMRACDPVTGCVCQSGWTGSECQDDVDECAEDPDVCGEGKLCVNNVGSYTCTCAEGYAENSGGVCEDIDECSEGTVLNTCEELELCHNVPGSHYCTCNKRYTRLNGKCTDVDECASNQNQCQQLCINVPGSYNCDCYYGFRLDSDRATCNQVADVCKEFEGLECDHGCSLDDSDKAFCFCRTGYKLATDLQTCLDEDECSLGTSGCSEAGYCVNTEGGYNCSCPVGKMLDNDGKTCLACPSGTYGENCAKSCACGLGSSRCDVITGCVCKSGWTGERCDQDINECETAQAQEICLAQNARCVNSQGGYDCRCAPGYEKNASNVCTDVNECDNSPCEQECENSPGSYRCLCNKGFSFNADTGTCEDVDECSLSATNPCTQRCDNTLGSFRCFCNIAGYVLDDLDGFTCNAVETCNRTDCPVQNGGCSEEQCFCNSGYQLTGSNTCKWIDEDLCASGTCEQDCAESSDGRSVICGCRDGYLLNKDQRTCRVCPAGTFGQDCSNLCTCNTQNSGSCDHVTGACNCTEGWQGSTCDDDIDECDASSSVACPAESDCVNTRGGHVCECRAGFYKTATDQCQACAVNLYGKNCAEQCTCSSNAESCNSVNGTCTCKAGWEGTLCENDVNECLTNQHSCSGDHVICINEDGGYSCGCEQGYKYNGSNVCLDVDECLAATDNCDQVCTNTVGSFNCSCGPAYLGTGNNCRDLMRVALVVTVQTTAPAGLFNPYGAVYALWKRMAEDALYDKLKPSVPGLRAVIIITLRRGSLIIEAEAVVNNETNPESASDLSVALLKLNQDLLTINNQTGIVGLIVGGVVVDSSKSVCDVYETISSCQSGTQCRVTDGAPFCKPVDEESHEAMIIALAVCIPVLILAVVAGIAVYIYKKPSSKTGPLMVDEFDSTSRPGTASSKDKNGRPGSVQWTSSTPSGFNAMPNSRQNSWTVDI